MTREEVVNSYDYKVAKASVDYSQKYAKDDELQGIVMDTFEDAAKFGYGLAVEKACVWLEETFKDGEVIAPLLLVQLIDKFRKDMKGE